MTILYIGQYTHGTTSKMRADQLKEILSPQQFEVIDIHQPFFQTSKLFRSIGFRYKRGPLVAAINQHIKKNLAESKTNKYDLIWVDKAVFITKQTTILLRERAKLLVHFTPDPAFTYHQSHHFKASINIYDYAITTKSYEATHYQKHLTPEKILITTQGFNPETHKPQNNFHQKKEGILFIGHCEVERERIIQKLLDLNIPVIIAGIKWDKFVNRNKKNKNLTYLGNGVYGADYAKTLSSYQFSWGALSKWIPELHTTRTFEIPACGTALITERNRETELFFNDDEAIFYNSPEEMVERIKYYQSHPDELEVLTNKGRERVIRDGRDYRSILKGVLKEMGIKG